MDKRIFIVMAVISLALFVTACALGPLVVIETVALPAEAALLLAP
jgi:hypothetical protein